MSIQKPYDINIRNQVLDGKKEIFLKWKTSGDTSASFSISIYNNATGVIVWSLPRTYSYALSYTIPKNSISNGSDYKLSITVWSTNGDSATSQFIVFTTSSTPLVTVNDIGTIGNHTNVFTAIYSQAENNPISTYTVNLFDSNLTLLKTSGAKTDGLLEHRFDLMKNGESYFIEFTVTSKKGLTSTSGLIPFQVIYENPNMYFQVFADNLNDKSSIRLHWSVVQVIGKTSISPVYLNGDELDIRNGKLFFDEGFEIDGNFTLKVWFREIVSNVDLVYLKGSNGVIRVIYRDDGKFHVFKEIGGFISHYATTEIYGNGFYLCLQQIFGNMNIYSKGNIPENATSLNNVTFQQLDGVSFETIQNTTF